MLKYPAKLSDKVLPVCLPKPNQFKIAGRRGYAAGWGMVDKEEVNAEQSPVLHFVDLEVSKKEFKTYKMFGTVTAKVNGTWKDVCKGDSGMISTDFAYVSFQNTSRRTIYYD